MKDDQIALPDKCISFLRANGIAVSFTEEEADNFLPGITIVNGGLVIHLKTLKYPGDILHEAGHIAVVESVERHLLNAETIAARPNREAEEMSAIAWSYAAALHLNIDPAFVFHEFGYKGGGASMLENFSQKRYIGVPMLQWMGLTLDDKNAAAQNKQPYPEMLKWMRE